MSERNYRPNDGPLGKYRNPGETPTEFPEVDIEAAMNLNAWRHQKNVGPFLDELIGYYRFYPAVAETAKKYVGGPRQRIVGREAVQQALDNRDEIIEAGARQVIHIAEGNEEALATFMVIARMREYALEEALKSVNSAEAISDDAAVWAADSILDLGMCIREPFTGKDWKKEFKRDPSIKQINWRIKKSAPNTGQELVEFGLYAGENPEALSSFEGVALMNMAADEQVQRVGAWRDCYESMVEAYPDIRRSEDILLERVPLKELLSIQDQKLGIK